MDNQEKLLESLKEQYRHKTVVLAAILAIAIYMIDRTFALYWGEIEPFGHQDQGGFKGLKYTYFTLSILWPIILALTCHIYVHISEKIESTENAVNTDLNLLRCLVPFYFSQKEQLGRMLRYLALLPIITVLFFSLSLLLIVLGDIYFSYFPEEEWQSNTRFTTSVFYGIVGYIVALLIALKYTKGFYDSFRK